MTELMELALIIYIVSLLCMVLFPFLGVRRGEYWREWLAFAGLLVLLSGSVFIFSVIWLMTLIPSNGVRIEVFGFVLIFVSFLFPAYFRTIKEDIWSARMQIGAMVSSYEEADPEDKEKTVYTLLGTVISYAWNSAVFLILALGIGAGLFGYVAAFGVLQIIGLMLITISGVAMLGGIGLGMVVISGQVLEVFRRLLWGEDTEVESASEGSESLQEDDV